MKDLTLAISLLAVTLALVSISQQIKNATKACSAQMQEVTK